MSSKILVNRCKCRKCGDVIESKSVHDWVSCVCGAIFTDGGTEYVRRGGEFELIEDMSEYEESDITLLLPPKVDHLYKFHWDCGRMGSVDGLFIADEATITAALGQPVHFGEILGKHSEIYGVLEMSDLRVVTSSPEVIAILRKEIGNTVSGYNPLSYLRGDE